MITKRITSFLDDEILCDLVEFRAILSNSVGLDMMDIQRDLDVEISENDDKDSDSSDDAEIAFTRIYELIQQRVERVGEENYPFSLNDNGSHFFLKPEITSSGYIYLFCLLLSHPKEDDVLTGSYVPNIGDNQRKLFQSCSTVAAAGLIAGNMVNFITAFQFLGIMHMGVRLPKETNCSILTALLILLQLNRVCL